MRYYFHIRSHEEYDMDVEGIELPSPEAALTEAEMSAREMVAERVLHGKSFAHMLFEITDAQAKVIGTIRFRDVIKFT